MLRVSIFQPRADYPEVISTSVLVRCEDPDRAARGLKAATQRLSTPSEFAPEPAEGVTGDAWAPSWVSEVWKSELGPALILDAGHPPAPMVELMRRIVVEELERAGITDAEVTSWPPNWQPSNQEWITG